MTLGSHQKPVGASQTYITPKWIIDILGPFDLDPCAANPRPWNCATNNYDERDDGFSKEWHGRVWLNPPFDRRVVGKWVRRLADHGSGTALLHARTETSWFRHVWNEASSVFFLRNRLKFYRQDGTQCPGNSGAPLVLASFGDYDRQKLEHSGVSGIYIDKWKP